MQLRPAGEAALIDRYIGYYKPYAISHAELDQDDALFVETRHAALTLAEVVRRYRMVSKRRALNFRIHVRNDLVRTAAPYGTIQKHERFGGAVYLSRVRLPLLGSSIDRPVS